MRYAAWLLLSCLSAAAALLPPPKYQSDLSGTLDLTGATLSAADDPKASLARQMLEQEARRLGASLALATPADPQGPQIVLQIISPNAPAGLLDEQDRRLLSDHAEQGYVLRVDPPTQRVLLAGASGQGVLYAAVTLMQLWRAERGRLLAPITHVRDFPDFRYRAAADWLLQAEINRWAYDWGDGRAAYLARIRRKLDFALRYKINMIFFDGFGWSAERTPGYSHLMREINSYARQRGIKLIFGGYGYYFTPEYLRPDRNIGSALLNRHYYPDGPVYYCMPGDPFPRYAQETALRAAGTCRSNAELQALRAAEIEDFVRSVEPGALYIHHEDHGDFEPTQFAWRLRCEYCRRRWPNDDLKAADGGAGAIAHGYRALIEAVRRVKNRDTGYDSARDCTVTLVSPVYRLREDSAQDWNNVLDFWESVMRMLPRDENLQVCFREIFPHGQTGQRWIDAYRQRMQSRGLADRTFLFFLGGSQGYLNPYPFTTAAAMNSQFLGAETIYNFSGGVHQEALQVLQAVYSWNARAPGSRHPATLAEARPLWEALSANRQRPEEIFQPGGLLDEICRQLYGPQAAPAMRSFLELSEIPPPAGAAAVRAPHFSERLVPLSVLFEVLERDARHWQPAAQGEVHVGRNTYAAADWYSRLAQLWGAQARLNRRAEGFLDAALRATDLDPGARDDIAYLKRCLQVGERFALVLADFHSSRSASDPREQTRLRDATAVRLADLDRWLQVNFRFDTVCPLGGDSASWLEAARRLRNRLSN